MTNPPSPQALTAEEAKNIYQQTASLLNELKQSTSQMHEGVYPTIHQLNDYHARLVDMFYQIGESASPTFGAKEHAYLNRKLAQGKTYKHARLDSNIKKAIKDAENEALESVEDEYKLQIAAEENYERHKMLRSSVGRAIDFIRSLTSQLKVWMFHST